jgi:XTP/dITP diphosphohydrolase
VRPLTITFATANPGKVSTAREHLAPLGIGVRQVQLDLVEIQSLDVREVALAKARQAFSALGCPLIVDDSAFGIDELRGFPGPLAKHTLAALGATGIARLADLTATRACRLTSCLVYIDDSGKPHAFTRQSHAGTVAAEPAQPSVQGAWSDLWTVLIPHGCTVPLAALPPAEAESEAIRWRKESLFTELGRWLLGRAQMDCGPTHRPAALPRVRRAGRLQAERGLTAAPEPGAAGARLGQRPYSRSWTPGGGFLHVALLEAEPLSFGRR